MRAVVGSSYTHSLAAERKGTHTYTITTPIPPSPLLATPQTSVLQTSMSTFDSSGCGPAPHPHLSWTQELPPTQPLCNYSRCSQTPSCPCRPCPAAGERAAWTYSLGPQLSAHPTGRQPEWSPRGTAYGQTCGDKGMD